jgi:tetratricopeptide (TPR) repeat protein
MILNTKNQILLLAVAFLLQGCASGGKTKPAEKAKGPAPQPIGYISTRDGKLPSPTDCPANEKSWKKENQKALVEYAGACARLGKWDRVEQLGDWLAQKEPHAPWGAFYLSLAAEGRKEWTRALWMIELALKKSPRQALLIYQKGRIYWGMGEFGQAAEVYNQALKENPRFVDAHIFLAQLYFRDQDFGRAAKHFATVMDLQPENAMATVGLAETRLQQGQTKVAVELYEKAVNQAPRQVSYRLKLAELYEVSMKDYSQALSAYRRIKSIMAESRLGAEEVPFDLNEKIRRLESMTQDNVEKKVTKTEIKGKVKK